MAIVGRSVNLPSLHLPIVGGRPRTPTRVDEASNAYALRCTLPSDVAGHAIASKRSNTEGAVVMVRMPINKRQEVNSQLLVCEAED